MNGMEIERIINEASGRLPVDQAILLYLSIVLEGDDAPALLSLLPDEHYQQIQKPLEQILGVSKHDRGFPLLEEVQRLSQKNEYHGVEEIDGSWILHYLKREKPAAIGLIMQHLPADKVYQILERMEPQMREKLPGSEVFARVSDEVIQVVRRCFEKNLVSFTPPHRPKALDFSCTRNLTGAELLTLVRDLGIDILALAFQGVNERSLIELVKNLDEEDAEKLFDKFSEQRSANRGDIKSSQLEILGLSLDYSSGSDLIIEAGVQRLARALVKSSESLVVVLQHKLPLKAGYQMRRFVDDYRRGTHLDATIKKLQDFIVTRIFHLSKKGEIDSTWASMKRLR